jgi:hypothetical protein
LYVALIEFGLKQIKSATSNLLETSASKIKVIVNGVNINEIEAILGDLPKKRTDFRKNKDYV